MKMKIIFCLLALNLIHGTVFSQKKLEDGIYRIDQSEKKEGLHAQSNKAVIQFNNLFVDENPEEYDPIVILTDDYVPLELAAVPVIKKDDLQRKMLSFQLTHNATKKLTDFTTNIPGSLVVIVVNGEAISIHKIYDPVTVGSIQLSRCKGSGFDQIYTVLKRKLKA